MENWYLVHTKPSRERHVAVQLHQRGFVVYLPLIWGNTGQFRKSYQRAYFPGYLFAKLDLEYVAANVIRWSPGVRGLVEVNGEPASIADEFVAELRTQLDRVRSPGGKGGKAAWSAGLLRGSDGLFAGFEGILNSQLPGSDRAQLLLAYVQQACWREGASGRPSRPRDASSTSGPRL